MVSVEHVHNLFDGLNPASALMSDTAEDVAASLQSQLETSKKIVEMTCQMATMTDFAREANQVCERIFGGLEERTCREHFESVY